MTGGHVVVARYDLLALDALDDPCVFIGDTPSNANCDTGSASPSGVAGRQRSRPSRPTRPARASREPPVQGSDAAERDDPAVGRHGAPEHPADRRRPAAEEGTYNTDTLIVVSIDPVTKQVAMFSLPRDSVDIPLPPGPLAQRLSAASTRSKINSLFTAVRNRPDLVPGNEPDPRLQRPQGRPRQPLRARHQVLRRGQLRRLQEGRRRARRRDDQRPGPGPRRHYPSDTGRLARVYIPAGIQHMTGAQALVYARSRQRLGRLRPRRPPAAGPHVAPRAGRHRDPDPADPAARSPRSRRRSRPTSRSASWRSWPGSPARSTRRTSARTCSRPRATDRRRRPAPRAATSTCRTSRRSGGGRERVQGRPAARGHARRARPGGRLDLGPQRQRPAGQASDDRRATSSTTG